MEGFNKGYHFFVFMNNVAEILGSIVVSILACHAGDRGSIPRREDCLFCFTILIRKGKFRRYGFCLRLSYAICVVGVT